MKSFPSISPSILSETDLITMLNDIEPTVDEINEVTKFIDSLYCENDDDLDAQITNFIKYNSNDGGEDMNIILHNDLLVSDIMDPTHCTQMPMHTSLPSCFEEVSNSTLGLSPSPILDIRQVAMVKIHEVEESSLLNLYINISWKEALALIRIGANFLYSSHPWNNLDSHDSIEHPFDVYFLLFGVLIVSTSEPSDTLEGSTNNSYFFFDI